MRKTFTAEFKATVGLEAVRGEKTVQEIGTLYEVHPDLPAGRQVRRPATNSAFFSKWYFLIE